MDDVKKHDMVLNIVGARDLIDFARTVLLAHRIICKNEYAPDLLPVVEYLLAVANCKHLYEVEKEVRST